MTNETLMTLVAYIKISTYREKTIKAIGDGLKMPTEIAKDSGILPNHISKVLKELKDHDLAVCINPEMRKGRLYKLTPLGKEVLKALT